VVSLDADLAAYYDQEALGRHRTSLGPHRARLREEFTEVLAAEGRETLVEVGAGPGLDAVEFAAAGVDVVGIDLSLGNARSMRRSGLAGAAASLYALPFRDEQFDALWTMSTFVHVPHARFDEAIAEMVRVVRPGGPLGVGTWGGFEWEGTSDRDTISPPRFFSLAGHRRWRALLEEAVSVDSFTTARPDADSHWEYQFAVVRAPRCRAPASRRR
jgi:SAM-dependent methyltransferase